MFAKVHQKEQNIFILGAELIQYFSNVGLIMLNQTALKQQNETK